MKKISTITKLLYSIVASLSILLIVLLLNETLKIKVIETNALEEDMKGFPSVSNTYIFLLDELRIKKYFYNNINISNVVIKKRFPQKIQINIYYRKRLAQLIVGQEYFYLDEQGVIFEKGNTLVDLPVLYIPVDRVDLGTNIIQKRFNDLLLFLKLSQEHQIKVINIAPYDQESFQVVLGESIQVLIGDNRKVEDIVSSLQLILRRFKIEGKQISSIDYRFEKPVISFN